MIWLIIVISVFWAVSITKEVLVMSVISVIRAVTRIKRKSHSWKTIGYETNISDEYNSDINGNISKKEKSQQYV